MRVIVTGGAGFIGSAVCRLLVAVRGHDVLNIDKLTYAGNSASLNSINNHPGYRFAKARHLRRGGGRRPVRPFPPDVVMHLAAESHVDRSIDGPGALHPDQHRRHLCAAGGRAAAYWRGLERRGARRISASIMSRPTRSSARSARGRPFQRGHALCAELALFRLARPRRIIWCAPGATPTACRRRHQLLEQLRALSLSRKADPADDPQRAGAASRCRSTATARTSATGCIVEDHARALLCDARTGAASARNTMSAAATSGATSTS